MSECWLLIFSRYEPFTIVVSDVYSRHFKGEFLFPQKEYLPKNMGSNFKDIHLK